MWYIKKQWMILSLWWLGLCGAQSTITTDTSYVRRERNLDHWDAETLRYYLEDGYKGTDVAIMFYAQWCRNCHLLAPYWDQIALLLKAGTRSSNLIMALFDCERNADHVAACETAGVTAYPTLLFAGAGDYHDQYLKWFRKKPTMGYAPIPNTVKFQGNWQYGDSILDWIKTMQMLSKWHVWTTEGMGKILRNGVLGLLPHKRRRKANEALPVGIPSAASSGSSTQLKHLQTQLQNATSESKQLEEMVVRSSEFLDAVLFPVNTTNTTDVFAKLTQSNGWKTGLSEPVQDVQATLWLTCTVELSLDYCQRAALHMTQDMLAQEDFRMDTFEQDLEKQLEAEVPYCTKVAQCLMEEFESPECRPAQCPFPEPGCNYINSCLSESIQMEYANALNLPWPPSEPTTTTATSSSGKSLWGM